MDILSRKLRESQNLENKEDHGSAFIYQNLPWCVCVLGEGIQKMPIWTHTWEIRLLLDAQITNYYLVPDSLC